MQDSIGMGRYDGMEYGGVSFFFFLDAGRGERGLS